MKKNIASFLSLCFLLASCAPITPTTIPIPTPTDPLDRPWEDRTLFSNGLIESQRSVLNELEGASIYHIEFTIADSMYEITGHEDVQYTNTETLPLDEVQFRLFPNILGGKMDVASIRVDKQSVTPQFDLNNSLLIIPFHAALEPGQSTVISMDFTVVVPQSVELNFGILAYFDNVLTLAHAYPMICVYDDEGWNAEIPPQAGDVTYGDSAFYLVKVNAPKGQKLVATGSEIQHDEAGETQALYVANGPARDFYLVASPAYKEVSQTFGEVTIHSYAMEGMNDGTKMALETASKAIETYSSRYSSYPYTEFDIVATPTLALGIEYPGMVAIASRIYDVSGDYNGTPTSIYMESTVAHEVGHQWFYGLVGDDQLDDPWLDESLTQFVTLQYYEDQYGQQGADGFRRSLEGRWERTGRADIPIGLPVADYSGGDYSAIVYGRGPLFFVALKDEMGAEKFDTFLKEYTATLSWGIATPEILQSMAEKNCACELDTLFNEWVYPK
jgi:hypothetical protein